MSINYPSSDYKKMAKIIAFRQSFKEVGGQKLGEAFQMLGNGIMSLSN